jgi:hypothetical protein
MIEPMRKRSTERAFVIQFDPVASPQARLRGRVEMVASGEAMRFASMKQLTKFLVEVLRRPADVEAQP